MTLGTASFLTIYAGGVPIVQWHNYKGGPNIDGHTFVDFSHNEMVVSTLSTSAPLQVSIPNRQDTAEFALKAFRFGLAVEVTLYGFTPQTDGAIPPTKTLLETLEGVAIDATETPSEITLEIGSEAPSNGVQVPPAPFDVAALGGLAVL